MSRMNPSLVIAFLLSAFAHSGKTADVEQNENRTIIEGIAPEQPSTKYVYHKDDDADKSIDGAAMLLNIPGLNLIQANGQLGAAEITYRGLTSTRLSIDLEGLNLNDPATGQVDANAMFLFAANKVQTDASSLSIFLPKFDATYTKGVVGLGSQNSFKVGANAGRPIGKFSSVFLAAQLTSTNGRFNYQTLDDKKKTLSRDNNDQYRMQALANYQRHSPLGKAHGLVAVHLHQGGIPGFAASPSPHLRSQSLFTGLSAGISRNIKTTSLSFNLANSLFDYSTSNVPKNTTNLLTSTHELSFGLKPLDMPAWIDMEFMQKLIIERAHSVDKTRIGAGFFMKRTSALKGRLNPKVVSNFSMLAYGQHGLLFKKDLGVTIEPFDFLTTTARLARSQRLPTFMELYADDQFNMGNPDLEPEGIWDFELGSNMRLGQIAHLQITGFLGYLSNAIVYVPYRNTKYRATNTSSARRHGIDLGLTVEPSSWLLIESKNSILKTKISATNAVMPKAPAFLGLTKVRLGLEDALNLHLQTRYRTSSLANIYGTLRTPGYVLMDASISAKIKERIGISFSVTNLLNNKHARDTYEMPLPSTTFFGQLEIGNI